MTSNNLGSSVDHPWNSCSELVQNLENTLQGVANHVPTTSEEDWHEQAINLASSINISTIHDASFELLREVPIDETLDLVDRLRTSKDPTTLSTLKKARKLFIIARDSMLLTEEHQPGATFDSLFIVSRYLGKVADTGGRKNKKITEMALLNLAAFPPSQGASASKDVFIDRARRYLHTEELKTIASSDTDMNPDDYHNMRKDFRRVSNVLLIATASSLGRISVDFARDGVLLNQKYGQINDNLYDQKQ